MTKQGLNGFLESITTQPQSITETDSLPTGLNYKRDYPRTLSWLRSLSNSSEQALDIETIIQRLNIRVVYEDMGSDNDISGYIEKRHQDWYIGVNRYENAGRQRFTMAHELAHLLFHMEIVKTKIENGQKFSDAIRLFRSKDDFRLEEMEANAFAAELLMPSDEFRMSWTKFDTVRKVANHFNVSLYAAEYRAKKLGLHKKEV